MTAVAAPRLSPVGLAGTVVAHGAMVLVALIASRGASTSPALLYEVNLVAAPTPLPALRNVAHEATPAAPKNVAPPVRETKHVAPAKTPPPPPPTAAKRDDKVPVTRTTTAPAVGERPSTGQDVVTLRQEGIPFPYPEYLRNIENKIFAQWNHVMFRPGFETQIAFVILRDGSVDPKSIEVVKSSGNYSFDLNARAAIDAVVGARGFGPLPAGFNSASLPILFDFKQVPRGGG